MRRCAHNKRSCVRPESRVTSIDGLTVACFCDRRCFRLALEGAPDGEVRQPDRMDYCAQLQLGGVERRLAKQEQNPPRGRVRHDRKSRDFLAVVASVTHFFVKLVLAAPANFFSAA